MTDRVKKSQFDGTEFMVYISYICAVTFYANKYSGGSLCTVHIGLPRVTWDEYRLTVDLEPKFKVKTVD